MSHEEMLAQLKWLRELVAEEAFEAFVIAFRADTESLPDEMVAFWHHHLNHLPREWAWLLLIIVVGEMVSKPLLQRQCRVAENSHLSAAAKDYLENVLGEGFVPVDLVAAWEKDGYLVGVDKLFVRVIPPIGTYRKIAQLLG